MRRRRLLERVTVACAAAVPVMLGVPVLGYLLAPLFQRAPSEFVEVGRLGDFALGAVTLVRVHDPSSLPWAGQSADTALWVRRREERGDLAFQVFAENCTHLGCPVEWRQGSHLFFCPCHGGVFYEDGRVAAGPPRQPLFEREWRVDGDRLLVRGLSLPTEKRRQ
ncbi:MAG: hypothetical protein AUI58_07420 [Chloroflexi bacterium 13_1_40CM_2_70_6]|nr:MAG: hypothetical protein AUI58_07420 [Chloroflexi bacterium 13_1_40CM_2_70_6]TMF63566.1 MAG: Rieske 2Fe-2S domain-containing protein [Chloroflexota bacterium]TMG37722.1 MAG: Rieske 2Fe-2S domain-containing protein [Chloroflexota bacterium]TMG41575.1 MAG: Rieske 2Fe-2S domain-containing protein [Chloroflexota bacterium]